MTRALSKSEKENLEQHIRDVLHGYNLRNIAVQERFAKADQQYTVRIARGLPPQISEEDYFACHSQCVSELDELKAAAAEYKEMLVELERR